MYDKKHTQIIFDRLPGLKVNSSTKSIKHKQDRKTFRAKLQSLTSVKYHRCYETLSLSSGRDGGPKIRKPDKN